LKLLFGGMQCEFGDNDRFHSSNIVLLQQKKQGIKSDEHTPPDPPQTRKAHSSPA
jgi:hypothetical protein